ncbi:MAG: GFA family protein [Pseudomonadota bacterium]
MAAMTGKCMCGAVTLTVIPAEQMIHACHCDWCRAWTGSAFMAVKAEDGDVSAEGPVKTLASSPWAERSWCDACGSGLWYRVTAPGPYHGEYHVAAGLLPDTAGFTLGSEIYHDRKPEGWAYAGDAKKMTKAEIEAFFGMSGEAETGAE